MAMNSSTDSSRAPWKWYALAGAFAAAVIAGLAMAPSAALALVLLAGAGYLAVCGLMAEKVSHSSRRPLTSTPAQYGLPFETIHFASAIDRIPLEGWYTDSPGLRVVMILHGKDGVRDDDTIGIPELARDLVKRGYDVLGFDFRGHGASGGRRVSLGTLETRDVDGAVEFLKARGVKEFFTIGFSLGAATALNSAPNHPEMRAIVADSSFADVNLLLRSELPKASGLPGLFTPGAVWMARLLFGMDLANDKPAVAVSRLGNRPLLLIHSKLDSAIPVSHAYALEEASANNPNRRMWILEDTEHVRAYKVHPEEYLERVLAFFRESEAIPPVQP